MKKLIILSILGCLTTTTFAQWKQKDAEQEFNVYLDTDRIKKDYPKKHNVQAWLKFVVHTDLTPDELLVGDYRIVRYEFNCSEKTRAISAFSAYKNKKLIASEEIKEPVYKTVFPKSTGEYNLNQVCDYVYAK